VVSTSTDWVRFLFSVNSLPHFSQVNIIMVYQKPRMPMMILAPYILFGCGRKRSHPSSYNLIAQSAVNGDFCLVQFSVIWKYQLVVWRHQNSFPCFFQTSRGLTFKMSVVFF
jgi:hypothetical protein